MKPSKFSAVAFWRNRSKLVFRFLFISLILPAHSIPVEGKPVDVDALKIYLKKHAYKVKEVWLPGPDRHPQTLVLFVPEIHSDKASKSVVKCVFLLQDRFPIKGVLLEGYLTSNQASRERSVQGLRKLFKNPEHYKIIPDDSSVAMELLIQDADLFYDYSEYHLLTRGAHAFPVIGMDNAETHYLQMVLSVYLECYSELQVRILLDKFKDCKGLPCDPQKRGVAQFLVYLEQAVQELSLCNRALGWKNYRSLELKLDQLGSPVSRGGINWAYLIRHNRAFNRFMGEVVLDIRNRIWMENTKVKAVLQNKQSGIVLINAGEYHILKPRRYSTSQKDLRDYLREQGIGYMVIKTIGEWEL
jgi:hypothetical protein